MILARLFFSALVIYLAVWDPDPFINRIALTALLILLVATIEAIGFLARRP